MVVLLIMEIFGRKLVLIWSGFHWEIPLKVNISDYPYPLLKISLIPLREGEYMIDKGKLLNEE